MKLLYKIVSGFFLAAFATLLAGTVAGNLVYGFLNDSKPNSETARLLEELGFGKTASQLEGRSYQKAPEVSAEALQSSAFQDSAEQHLADLIPQRDEILLMNAALQRTGIEIAAKPFGYQVYSTYYGSDHIYDATNDVVTENLDPATQEEADAYEAAATVYSAFAERHSDLDVVMYRVDHTGSSVNNPSHDLVNDVVDSDFLTKHFYSLLNDRVSVIDGVCDSIDESLDLYYRSDHHWNIRGAFTAYEQIAKEFSFTPVSREDLEYGAYDEVVFYGSFARAGLCLVEKPDVIEDYWFEGDGIEVLINGKEKTMQDLSDYQAFLAGDVAKDAYSNRYAEYFHYDAGLIELHNEKAEGGTLLIVADSFSNPIERYFALNYKHVYVLDPRHSEAKADDLIAEHGVDDILVILSKKTIVFEEMQAALSPA